MRLGDRDHRSRSLSTLLLLRLHLHFERTRHVPGDGSAAGRWPDAEGSVGGEEPLELDPFYQYRAVAMAVTARSKSVRSILPARSISRVRCSIRPRCSCAGG